MISALRKFNIVSRTGLLAVFLLAWIACASIPQSSYAMLVAPGGGGTGMNGSVCTDGSGNGVQGFSIAIVFCIREVIEDSLFGMNNSSLFPNITIGQGYMQRIIVFLAPFKWGAIVLAFTLYGVKLMTLSAEQVMKESSILLFKTGMVLFLIDNLSPQTAVIYPGGIYAALTGAMDELVGWVSNVLGAPPTWCTTFPMPQPGALSPTDPLPPMPNPNPYIVWQYFDCIFQGLMNAGTSPAGVTTAAVSIVIILGAAMWSGGFGIFLIIMAVTLFVAALFALMRAIYAVLLAYFMLALLLVVGPLLVPMMVFDYKYTFEIYWKWLGMITSTILTPLFVVGFLCFVIMTETEMVDGNGAAFAGCQIGPRYPGDTAVAAGNCSINQLLNSCTQSIRSPINDSLACLNYDNYAQYYPASQQPNGVIEPWRDPDLRKCCVVSQVLFRLYLNMHLPYLHQHWCQIRPTHHCGWTDPFGCVENVAQDVAQVGCDVGAGVATGVVDAVAWTGNQLISLVNDVLSKIKVLVPLLQFPIKQMIIIVMALFITTIVFRDLLEVVPHMAREISLSVGVGLLALAQVPLERLVGSATKSFGENAKAAMSGKKGLSSLKSMPGALGQGLQGAGRSIWDSVR